MSYHVDVLPKVQDELYEAYLWYEEQQHDLGKRFIASFRTVISDLACFPLSYQIGFDDVRKVRLAHFPYVVYYIIENQKIIVVALLHGAKNPETIIKTIQQQK